MDRIESLRKTALERTVSYKEFFFRFYKRYTESGISDRYERYADAYSFAFSTLTPFITDGELIVGEIGCGLNDDEEREWIEIYKPRAEELCKDSMRGQDSHMAVDYEKILSGGLVAIEQDIEGRVGRIEGETLSFYRAALKCLRAVMDFSDRYSDLAESLAKKESDPKRKKELKEIARICKKVPRFGAESFHEALQSVNFITFCLSMNPLRLNLQQFQLGRPDRYLLRFYESDIRSGRITKKQAQLLLDCLGIQINMRVSNGLSSGYMIGGRDNDGNVVANDLTLMCMRVIDDIRLVYPSVGLAYTEDMPREYLAEACRILSNGRSHPAIFNDDIIARGLARYGVRDDEQRNYIHSTCVEITPIASSNVWVASPYTNMPSLLLKALKSDHDSFDELLSSVLSLLDKHIERNFYEQLENRRIRAKSSINPLLSCLVNDCIERGLDIEAGGARYNWIMPSFVGVANLVDSLYAVKCALYDEKRLSIGELRGALENNFEGKEELRQYLLNGIPKYGNDCDEVDKYFSLITEHIVTECKKYKGLFSGAELIPSVFCWIMHEWFGRETGATPDGRLSGFPLGDGSGPCQGRERLGPTASINSSTKWNHEPMIGGVAVNMKFSKSSLGTESIRIMESLVRSYMKRGGFEMQINVTDKTDLLRAVEHPEEYRDLVVRIGGYSDYFTRISPAMQREVIERTEHVI